ncbi:MAG: hypothetical protein Ta2B_03240 [Termitinemataceae bacterium]|nr:MAG: hypothetical protein Ta2B_03240 [Termitinemataceae bacterium]
MKKLKKLGFFSALLLILLMISCKSTPKPQDTSSAGNETAQTEENSDGIDYSNIKATVGNLGDLLAAANEQRSEILANEFEKNDADNFALAEDALKRASDVYQKSNGKPESKVDKKAIQDASLALNTYRILLDSGWMAKIDDAKKASSDAQQAALKMRADVAAKDGYNLAAEMHNKGASSYRSRDWQTSYNYFVEAKPLFDAATLSAAEKRRVAELALKNAEKKIAESEKLVSEAEQFLIEKAGSEPQGEKL